MFQDAGKPQVPAEGAEGLTSECGEDEGSSLSAGQDCQANGCLRGEEPPQSEESDVPDANVPTSSRWGEFEELRNKVLKEGTQILYGVQVGRDYCSNLDRLVKAELFDESDAGYLRNGITWGFDMDIDSKQMRGKRVYKNYPTAFDEKEKVTSALKDRVRAGKTLKLGAFSGRAEDLPGTDATVVPMGSVGKKLETDKVRPFSDHTRTRFNAAARTRIEHTLNTYDEIATELKPNYTARIEDVDAV